jgi:hypothetical protein
MKEITVKDVNQATCAVILFTLAEIAPLLIELDANLTMHCNGKRRVQEEDGGHRFTYASAQVAADKILGKMNFIVSFMEAGLKRD